MDKDSFRNSSLRPQLALLFFLFGCYVFYLAANHTQQPRVRRDYSTKQVSELIKLLDSKNRSERVAAADELGERRDEAAPAIPRLIEALNDESSAVVRESVRSLRAIGLPLAKDAIPALYDCLRHSDYAVSRAASFALVSMLEEKAVPELMERFRKAGRRTRAAIAQGLIELGPSAKSASADLITATHSKDLLLCQMAVEALGAIREEKAVPHLVPLLDLPNPAPNDEGKNRRLPWIRNSAAEALGEIGEASTPAAERLLEMFFNDDHARSGAAEGLAGIGSALPENVIRRLSSFLTEGKDWRQVLAAYILRHVDTEETKTTWKAFANKESAKQEAKLGENDPHKRGSAVRALGFLGSPKSFERLLGTLYDPDEIVRVQSATALGRFGDPRAVPHLVKAMKSKEFEHSGNPASALRRFDTPEAKEALRYHLRYLGN